MPTGQIGDHVDGLAALLAGLGVGAVAYDLDDLGGVELRRHLAPGQGPHLFEEVLLVPFHREGVVLSAQ